MNQSGSLSALAQGQSMPQQQAPQGQPMQGGDRQQQIMAMLEKEPDAKQIVQAMVQSAQAGKPFDEKDLMTMLDMSKELGG